MAGNSLNNSDPKDVLDPELFTAETSLLNVNFYSQKGDVRTLMTGQTVADQSISIGDVDALVEMDESTTALTVDPAVDYVLVRDTSTGLNRKVLVNNLGGAGISTYALVSNRLFVTGTTGITAAIAGGVLTITIPAGGALTGGSFNFLAGDASYTGTNISNGLKILVDDTANGAVISRQFQPSVYTNTNTNISATDPAIYNTSLTLNSMIDEFGSGLSSFVIRDVPAGAPSGGIIIFS